jgi:PAS domain-containing protein
MNESATTGKKIIFEYELPLSGVARWFQAKILSIKNVLNERRYIVNTIDITERKRTEEALRESERLLRQSQKVAHIGSYVSDLKTRTWRSSLELNEIFGIDETYPHTREGWIRIIHPNSRKELSDYYLKIEA